MRKATCVSKVSRVRREGRVDVPSVGFTLSSGIAVSRFCPLIGSNKSKGPSGLRIPRIKSQFLHGVTVKKP